MATKSTIPFNYDDIYSSVQQKFVDKGYDVQEGSNTMQLVSAMSYLISMLNANTAINVNENLLTLARKRKNILQDSRILGYEPGNKVSYQYKLSLKFTPNKDVNGDFIETSFSIPKYSIFTANSKNYYYMGDLLRFQNITEEFTNDIIVKEGNLIKSEDDPDNLIINVGTVLENLETKVQYYVDIPYTNIEDDGIDCFLTYYDDNAYLVEKEVWNKFDRFEVDIDTILSKQFYRLNVIEYDTPRIYLKLPNRGEDLRMGSKVEFNILVTSGTAGAMLELPKTDINCEVLSYSLKLEGTEEESNESIKYNAPLFYNSANRAVTKNDYISICNRFTFIDKTFVWDGNDEYPMQAGKIWFSFIPQTRVRKFDSDLYRNNYLLNSYNDEVNWYIEDDEIQGNVESIFDRLESYKIPTLKFLHRHPIYFDFKFTIQILKYDITLSETKQNSNVFSIIDRYFHTENDYNLTIENFEKEFFLSNLIKRVDAELADITGCNITLDTEITINSKCIINENSEKRVILPLGLPYVGVYNTNGGLIVDNLPKIDTANIFELKDLTVDFSNVPINAAAIDVISFPIYFDTEIIGQYKLFNSKYIVIDILVDETILTEEIVKQFILLVKYKNNNMKFVKNTMPRLKEIKFI